MLQFTIFNNQLPMNYQLSITNEIATNRKAPMPGASLFANRQWLMAAERNAS